MTVVLCGIGADTTNAGRVAPIYPDNSFEYVPIPEKTRETAESETYGTWDLRYGDGVAADLLTSITPDPAEGTTISGKTVGEWPVHHDPNFDVLTYGEHRPGYVSKLRELDPGDVVGFYAGLREPGGERVHRYLIGYFTVESVEVLSPEMSKTETRAILERHPENAHAKRARDGDLYYDSEVVIVDGREPGGLFERDPIRMSEYYVAEGNQRAQYYLDGAVAREFEVVEGKANMQFKPAYLCALSGSEFLERVPSRER